jgi:hypothetical protein
LKIPPKGAKDQKRRGLFQPKEEAPAAAATWASSQFDDPSRKDKFLSLLGAKKHKLETRDEEYNPEDVSEDAKQVQSELEQQYNLALNAGKGRLGLGL